MFISDWGELICSFLVFLSLKFDLFMIKVCTFIHSFIQKKKKKKKEEKKRKEKKERIVQ